MAMSDRTTFLLLGGGLVAVWWWQREQRRKSIPPPGVMQYPSLPYGNYGQNLNGGVLAMGDCPPGYVPGPLRPCWNGDCPPECVPVVGTSGAGGGGVLGEVTPNTAWQ